MYLLLLCIVYFSLAARNMRKRAMVKKKLKPMKTMISNLPKDLLEEIISRVPLKSMKSVRLTCKSWNFLSKSESFAKMHIGKTTREGETMMMALNNNFYLISVVVDVDPSIEFKGKLSFLYDKLGMTQVLDFEGLLLCKSEDCSRIMVWNPYWGQTRWIKLRYMHCPHKSDDFIYGLGYEDKGSCRNVKLLRFIDYYDKEPEKQFFWYEIYDFDSGLWKTLDVTAPHWGILFCVFGDSVSVKGNTYWCTIERNSKDSTKYIICFDFTKERFGPLLPLPRSSSVSHTGYPYVTLSCVREEKLVVLFHDHNSHFPEIDIWITTKIEADTVSWSKFLRIDIRPEVGFPRSSCISEEKKVFMGFNNKRKSSRDYDREDSKRVINIIGEDGYLKKMDFEVPEGNQNCWRNVWSYVPSLIQIKKSARGKRIKQSPLEKLRYDQHKSRFDAIYKA